MFYFGVEFYLLRIVFIFLQKKKSLLFEDKD